MASSQPAVRTRLLMVADTHGFQYIPDTKPLEPIDVVIHCGDITADSSLHSFQTAIDVLRQIPAAVKLVIPGNHDFTLDEPTYRHLLLKARKRRSFPRLLRSHGQPGDARRLFDLAAQHNIIYLDEGTHRILLPNSATLTVFASPYTPAFGTPGFQYSPKQSRNFDIPPDVDVVVTHGPPRGVRDRSWVSRGKHVGSVELFDAVERARPRVHCFGHIHEGWGAEVVRWRGESRSPATTSASPVSVGGASEGRRPSEGSESGEGSQSPERKLLHSSTVIADLGSVLPLKGDTPEVVKIKKEKLAEYQRGKCVLTSHCVGDVMPVEKGVSTLFVNAAVAGSQVRPPWVVDVELPVRESEAVGEGRVFMTIE